MGSDGLKTLIVALYNYNGQGLDSWIDHGAGMTYTAAKKAGCDVSFCDMKALKDDEELCNALKGYDLIAVSMKSSYYSIGMKVIRLAKDLKMKVLVGGYHATAAPNELIDDPLIDYIFKGESEITFPKFLNSLESFQRVIVGEKPQNLDDLPFIDRSIYKFQVENCLGWWHGNKLAKMITVMAARGCPYKCAFCQPLENNHFGKKLRRRSVDSLIAELKMLKDKYNPECVMIHDDTFLLQPKWIEEFVEKYPQINLPFWASARADGVCKHPDLVKKLVDVGWDLVSVGFESGSQRILDLLKKGTTVEQNLESAKIIHSCGAKIYANYMTAIPWETKWDVQATHKMADQIKAEMPSWAYFTPYPGCEWGEKLIERGWSLLDRNHYDRCPSGVKSSHVDYEYIKKVRKGFREDVYPTFTDIIIPAYNNTEYSVNCIDSIKRYTKPGRYRIIFVDNHSEKDSVKEVKDHLKYVDHLFIQMPKNEGFVGAVNAGLEKSNAPNVCLLNNDTLVSKGWLEKLVKSLGNDPQLGIVGALTGYGKGTAVDSHHSLSLHNNLLPKGSTEWNLDRVNKYLYSRYPGETRSVAFVAFLCAVIKREVIDKVGLLDPNYAMGMWDDLDYNRSVWEAGYKTELAIDTCITHFGRSTFNLIQMKEKFDVDSLLATNRAYLNKKWSSKSIKVAKNKPLIISRAIYSTVGDKKGLGILTDKRLSLMQNYFINSLKIQTDKDFSICLIVGNMDNEPTRYIKNLDWGDLDINFLHSNSDLSKWTESVEKSRNYGREIDEGCPEYIVRNSNHPTTSIMARLDTDDWVAPGWVASIRYIYDNVIDSRFIINYQVFTQAIDGRVFQFHDPHTYKRISPFMVLVQRSKPYMSPYHDLHLNMGKYFSKIITVPPGYAYMVVNGTNRSNRIYKNDKALDEIAIESAINTEDIEANSYEAVKTDRRRKYSDLKDSWKSRLSKSVEESYG